MNDYSQIRVSINSGGKVDILDSAGLPLIGIGGHGAVFLVDEYRCIKVYPDEKLAEPEKHVYLSTIGSKIMPVLYETGDRYLVIEYVNGPNLRDYLLVKGNLSPHIALELVNMFHEMNRLCFLRRDESLRHILVKGNEEIKVVDHYYAFTLHNPLPVKMFTQLGEIGMLEAFIQEGSKIAPQLFNEFRELMPEFFPDCNSSRERKTKQG